MEERLALSMISKIIQNNSFVLSFNGGKDCTVLLHLISQCTTEKIPCIYIRQPDTFTEIDSFVLDCCQHFNIILYTVQHPSIRHGVAQFLKMHQFSTIFVGTRKTDPHGLDLQRIQMTDISWPGILRIHPILDWHLKDIWQYILNYNIPYCILYDQGYSSIGHKSLTNKNPKLRNIDESWQPAHMLVLDEFERFGRN